jgi:hypothetical protein
MLFVWLFNERVILTEKPDRGNKDIPLVNKFCPLFPVKLTFEIYPDTSV